MTRTRAAIDHHDFGRDFATAMNEFRRDGSASVGRESQTWVGWKVVAAQVSVIAP